MFRIKPNRVTLLLLANLFVLTWLFGAAGDSVFLQSAHAASETILTQLPVRKVISQTELEKYKSISITVDENGKQVKYDGVAMRGLLAEMLPEYNLDTMKDWKALARQELVMEVTGEDGYPGLVTALEVAMNKSGDHFLLAMHRDGQRFDSAVQLICKADEAHTRWVHQVVLLRVVQVPKAIDSSSTQITK